MKLPAKFKTRRALTHAGAKHPGPALWQLKILFNTVNYITFFVIIFILLIQFFIIAFCKIKQLFAVITVWIAGDFIYKLFKLGLDSLALKADFF